MGEPKEDKEHASPGKGGGGPKLVPKGGGGGGGGHPGGVPGLGGVEYIPKPQPKPKKGDKSKDEKN